ncbi:hypothetical protein Taro_047936 [Colocasia esculenta]|uniref:Uncharacterized protein n=1 Tax=Colocasia esculenta TaxID=4460 RepID=A0A843X5Z2_COLES|nr:hypothetical protein [Colocasia esculenta]
MALQYSLLPLLVLLLLLALFLDLIAWPIFSTTAPERSTPKCLKILIRNIDFFIATELRLHKGKPLLLLRSEKLGAVATQTAGDDRCGHGFRWESLWRVETEGEEKESSRNFCGKEEEGSNLQRVEKVFHSGLPVRIVFTIEERGSVDRLTFNVALGYHGSLLFRSLDLFFVEETRSDTTCCPVDKPRGGEG